MGCPREISVLREYRPTRACKGYASEFGVPGCQKLHMTAVWHRMLYSFTVQWQQWALKGYTISIQVALLGEHVVLFGVRSASKLSSIVLRPLNLPCSLVLSGFNVQSEAQLKQNS